MDRERDMGASLSATGLSQAEPKVSALRASIPSAEDELIERWARAIYDAEDPLSGDHVATVIHMSEHLFWDGIEGFENDIDAQLEAVMEICRAAARAVLDCQRADAREWALTSASAASGIEAQSGETTEESARSEGREPGPQGDAHNPDPTIEKEG